MDLLKSAGVHVAGASLGLVGLASYLMWPSASPQKAEAKKEKQSGCWAFFFNDEGAECLVQPDHNINECRVENCQAKHIRIIKNILMKATSSVDVCLYNLNQREVEECLVDLLRRGVRVRCVAGDSKDDERPFVRKLRSEGAFVTLKDYKPPSRLPFQCSELLMHHKFVVIDKKIVITGSMNWTTISLVRSWDHIIISVNPHLVKQFAAEFDYLHTNSSADERSCTLRPVGGVPFQACFFRRKNIDCRIDANKKKKCDREDCMYYVYKSILHKIISATVSIDLCVQQLTTEDISLELMFAHENGVKVRVVSEEHFSKGTGSQIPFFLSAGIPVHVLKTQSETLHHKFIIVDGKILLAGSLNWTMQSFFGNYENVLVISQKDVVARFQQEFEKLWNTFPAAT